jgi:hypothetical protein
MGKEEVKGKKWESGENSGFRSQVSSFGPRNRIQASFVPRVAPEDPFER